MRTLCSQDNRRVLNCRHRYRICRHIHPALFFAIYLLSNAAPGSAQTQGCRQALALGLDVSGSVDTLEYRLQLDGLAAALGTPRVRSALLSAPDTPVEILVYEWSGTSDQHILVNWTPIRTADEITALQSLLASSQRRAASPATALGNAMLTGFKVLNARSDCWVRTLDISGDGKSNSGPEPRDMKTQFERAKINVNALVVGVDSPGIGDLRQEEIGELAAYFQTNVITGPDAFVQTALGYEDYANAMARKLERELKGLVVSGLPVDLPLLSSTFAPLDHQ